MAGDVSDDLDVLRKTLELLTSAYGHVFYTVGNHELWVRRAERGRFNSITKLHAILKLCQELGVRTSPAKIGDSNVWIVPLWSWYHSNWDREPDVPGAMPIERIMMDFHACAWPEEEGLKASGDDSLASYFDGLNDPTFTEILEKISRERAAAVAEIDNHQGIPSPSSRQPPVVISFSHFLPLQELLPEKRWLHFPNLAKACGSDYVATRVKKLAPAVHVYGHTHFTQDSVIDGVRYVQWPLGYPRDQARRRDGGIGWSPLAVWDASEGQTAQRRSYWSDFYRQNERKPNIVSPAPWVSSS